MLVSGTLQYMDPYIGENIHNKEEMYILSKSYLRFDHQDEVPKPISQWNTHLVLSALGNGESKTLKEYSIKLTIYGLREDIKNAPRAEFELSFSPKTKSQFINASSENEITFAIDTEVKFYKNSGYFATERANCKIEVSFKKNTEPGQVFLFKDMYRAKGTNLENKLKFKLGPLTSKFGGSYKVKEESLEQFAYLFQDGSSTPAKYLEVNEVVSYLEGYYSELKLVLLIVFGCFVLSKGVILINSQSESKKYRLDSPNMVLCITANIYMVCMIALKLFFFMGTLTDFIYGIIMAIFTFLAHVIQLVNRRMVRKYFYSNGIEFTLNPNDLANN